ncbi:transglycosylase SLT domain-containing protein [Streptacidiphilus sp. N1-12]|uniref:Transglycosylase SLT domain-containing protein n=2 Tax=Streptacidiphilus alkalitolerans TaxID=3342712 RepID=A0ABV6VGG5_9ACTN
MNRISVRGVAVASATAVTAVGAVVGVASGSAAQPTTQVADAAGSTLLADIPSGDGAQTVVDNLARQADAQQADADAAAQKAADQAARIKAANAAKAKADADKAAKAAAQAHADALAASRAAARATLTKNFSPGSVQAMALAIVGQAQYQCFSNIVTRESGWNYTATNPSSGAYGLVQALPGDKMASAGADWRTNPETQIKWGLTYMNSRYGSPCGAWSYWQVHHSY